MAISPREILRGGEGMWGRGEWGADGGLGGGEERDRAQQRYKFAHTVVY